MAIRWKKDRIEDNDGKPLECWRRDGLLIHLNVNQGRARRGKKDRNGDRWWFEVFDERDDTIGCAPTLSDAKAVAAAYLAKEEIPTWTPEYPSVGQPVARPRKEPAKARPKTKGLLSGLRRFAK